MEATEVVGTRLANTALLRRERLSSAELVSRLLAVQAQDYLPTKWSLYIRSREATSSDTDRALGAGDIIRTHVLRPTWHLVASRDIHWLLALTAPRVQKGTASRYRELGLDAGRLRRCAESIQAALQGGNQLTRGQIADVLSSAGENFDGQRLPHILMYCELEGLIGSGTIAGREHTYALLDERVAENERHTPGHPVVELVGRYLESHGPASVRDLAWWSGLKVADLRAGLDGLGGAVRSVEVAGVALWMLNSSAPPVIEDTVYLLPAYDEMIVGYTESRHIGDPRAEDVRSAWRSRTLPTGTVLRGTRILGHWRRTISTKVVRIEVMSYAALRPGEKAALEEAVDRLAEFTGRSPVISTYTVGG
jgi:hypothetical protein